MKYRKAISAAFIFLGMVTAAAGQTVLQKKISLEISRQRLDQVLEIMSNKGDFYFSYNSSIVKKDSLVSFRADNKTVKDILSQLFNTTYEFRESGNYVIIRKAPIRMTIVTQKGETDGKVYSVSGYVYDETSGAAIPDATIYEKSVLVSALTNTEGFFRIKLKSSKASVAELSVSKEFYEDTTVSIRPHFNQEISITLMPSLPEGEKVVIKPEDYLAPEKDAAFDSAQAATSSKIAENSQASGRDSINVQRTGIGKFLLSAKQKIQSMNLRKFFTTRPFQFSLVPGVGTHGQMSAQVVNNFSLNLLGGYTAGTNGLEIGGLFNIDKKEVKYVQVAGLFNAVGGSVKGLQVAGINNLVFDSVKAMQVGGVNNLVKGKFGGLQVAGVYNHVTDTVKGMQVAGVGNFSNKKVGGVQIAGVANVARKQMNGVQVAGVFNYAKKLKGVQIGLINIADTSEGYSIGLINIVLKGYHQLGYSVNEIQNVNLAFKTGSRKLYSILHAGMNASNDSIKTYSFGYGLGTELPLFRKGSLSLNPELSTQYVYRGSWDYTNLLNRINLHFQAKIGKYFSLYAGPSFSVYISDQPSANNNYGFPLRPGYKRIRFSNKVSGWFGWSAGISFF